MDFIGEIISAPFICIGWIIVGAIAGSIARSLMGSKNSPFISDVILGIAGSFIGGLVAGILGMGPGEDASGLGLVVVNLIIATIGASILIFIGRMIMRR